MSAASDATRVSYLSPEQGIALHPALVRSLFENAGSAGPPSRSSTPLDIPDGDPLALSAWLWARRVPMFVADALDAVATFGTPVGREALFEAARERRMDMQGWHDEGPVNLAARLSLDPAARADLFPRARIRLARMLPERPIYEMRGATARPAGDISRLGDELREASGDGWSRLLLHEDDDE